MSEAFTSRKFDEWQTILSVYADWLEEHHASLFPMARSIWKFGPTHNTCIWKGNRKFQNPYRVTIFVKPSMRGPIGSDIRMWLTSQRCNRHELFGIPSASLRITRFKNNEVIFSALLTKLRHGADRMDRVPDSPTTAQLRSLGIYHGFDTQVHPHGFPALFWPQEFEPSDSAKRSNQQTLWG